MGFHLSFFQKRAVLVTILIFAGLVAVLTIVYIVSNRESTVLNVATRRQLGGSYVSLQSGVTHYQLTGPPSAPAVVFLHGYTVSIWDFDLQEPPLLDAGFQVLRYDSLGRGLSDRPLVPYTRALYVQQLEQLITALLGNSPVVLVGHSLGGAIAMEFASENPKRVEGIVLVSPVVNSVHSIPPFVVCNTPVIGDFLLRIGMVRVLQKRALAQWDGVDVNREHYAGLFEQQVSIQGFEHALCSMFRTDMVGDYRKAFQKVGQQQIPGLMVFGEEDSVVWKSEIDNLRPFLKSFSFEAFKGGGHSEHVQSHQQFNELLIAFLTRLRKGMQRDLSSSTENGAKM